MKVSFQVVRDGNGWGVEDINGFLENQTPLATKEEAQEYQRDLYRAHEEWESVQRYWSQSIFGE